MNKNFDLLREQHQFHHGRFHILMLVMIIFYMILILRLAKVTLADHDFWLAKRQKRFEVTQFRQTPRQVLVDINNFVLATTLKTYSIGWKPSSYSMINEGQKILLSDLTQLEPQELEERLQSGKKFIFLKRKMILDLEQHRLLNTIPGIVIIKEDKRFYPLEEASAQLLGFLSQENEGVEGLEAALDYRLKSRTYRMKKTVDAKGNMFSRESQEPKATPLTLALDSRFQSLLYRSLSEHIQKYPAASYSAVLLNVKSSTVAAMVTYPSFNPNNSFTYGPSCRLKPLLDSYEPGSVIKPFSVACILDAAPQSLTEFNTTTAPGYLMIDGHKIIDVAKRNELNLTEVLLYSSNIGVTRLLQTYSSCDLHRYLLNFGFDQTSGAEYNKEITPIYPKRIKKGSFVEATLGFGYGLQMNLLQLARAYSVFARKGELTTYSFLNDVTPQIQQVIDPAVASQITSLLAEVVKRGSARGAYDKKYPIAGKTGTAQRVGPQGYEQRYNSFFVSFFPVDNPTYVLVLHADDPSGLIYGGQICAPLAKKLVPAFLAVSQKPTFMLETRSTK